MKSYIAVAALAAVAQVHAQATPQCVQTCIGLMLAQATELGCASQTDLTCLCSNANFGYGVRDCSSQSCPAGTDTSNVLQTLETQYCASASGASSVSAGASSSAASLASSVSSGAAGAGSATAPSAITTEGVYSTITTDGSTITSLVSASRTVFGFVTVGTSDGNAFTSTITEAASSAAGSAASSASSGASSAASSASSEASGASSSAESVASSASSAASSRASSAASAASSGASSASSAAAAPMVTMAYNGVAGLAGLAAVMLL